MSDVGSYPIIAKNGGTGVINANTSTITLGGAFAMSGAYTFTGTLTGNTAVTFPTSGTLATTSSLPTLPLSLANGGTNAALTASNGGIFYSSGTAGAILSGTATANQVLLSGSSTTPAWSTATYPATTTINQVLYSSSNNVIAGITAANNGVMISGTGGIPSFLANGTAGYVLTAQSGAPPAWAAASSGGITTIDGDSGSVTGSTITISGGSSGAVFTGSSTTLTESFNYFSMATTSSSNGQIKIGGTTILQAYGSANMFIGVGAGNFSVSGNNNFGQGTSSLAAVAAGSGNIAMGYQSGQGLSSASNVILIGSSAASSLNGSDNIGIGRSVLSGGTITGSYNIAIGTTAGASYSGTESSNILLSSNGVASESNVLRIGSATGTSAQNLNAAYICGIAGVTVSSTAAVLVNTSTNQLGTVVSSERYKENISDMNSSSDFIYKLRPVNFTYKKNPEKGTQTGLIAEEVLKVAPQLVCLDPEGLPCSVSYHELPAILLNEIQRLNKRIEVLEAAR